jgi:nitroreductase
MSEVQERGCETSHRLGLCDHFQKELSTPDSLGPIAGANCPRDRESEHRKQCKQRAERYLHLEAGHAAQNVHLQAVALDVGTVVVGAFDDAEVKQVLSLAANERPLCLMPIGKLRS